MDGGVGPYGFAGVEMELLVLGGGFARDVNVFGFRQAQMAQARRRARLGLRRLRERLGFSERHRDLMACLVRAEAGMQTQTRPISNGCVF
ncbi:MAG: hypothetical protein ACRD3N_03630 [Terracidiphilus sp.]